MKRVLFSILLGTAAGCARLETPSTVPAPAAARINEQLRARSYSASELGIAVAGEPGKQTIRWKEAVSPGTPVHVPLLPAIDRAQPRVRALVNDSPVTLSIDTGAALNVFHAADALAAGVKVADPRQFANVFRGLGGEESAWYGMFDRVTIGALAIRNLFTVLRPGAGESREEAVDNALGLATLAKFAGITIDYPRGELILSLDQPPGPANGQRVAEAPFTLKSLQLLLDVEINRQWAITVMLDTGNDAALMLTEAIIEEIGLAETARRGKKARFAGIGGVIETRVFTVESVRLGGAEFRGVEVTSVPNDFPPALGSGFLQPFRTTLDFKGGEAPARARSGGAELNISPATALASGPCKMRSAAARTLCASSGGAITSAFPPQESTQRSTSTVLERTICNSTAPPGRLRSFCEGCHFFSRM